MTHEMTRDDARAAGYDVDDLPAVVEGPSRGDDVVNVWSQLPDAETIDVEDGADYSAEISPPPDAFVDELTEETHRRFGSPAANAGEIDAEEATDT